jgi:hypothetical protein
MAEAVAIVASGLFGLIMAAYYRHGARKHNLPLWSQLRAEPQGRRHRWLFFTIPEDARWNAEWQAVEFGVEIGEYEGVVRVPRRVFQRLFPVRPTPERYVEAYYLQRTRFERVAERKLRRRQVTEDGNVEISGRDLREAPAPAARIPQTGYIPLCRRSSASRASSPFDNAPSARLHFSSRVACAACSLRPYRASAAAATRSRACQLAGTLMTWSLSHAASLTAASKASSAFLQTVSKSDHKPLSVSLLMMRLPSNTNW